MDAGDIPKHWDISRIKYKLSLIGSGSTPDSSDSFNYDGEFNWIQSGDLYKNYYIQETEKTITKYALNSTKTLKMYTAPFVVIAMYGASAGTYRSNIDAYANQACAVLKVMIPFTRIIYFIY